MPIPPARLQLCRTTHWEWGSAAQAFSYCEWQRAGWYTVELNFAYCKKLQCRNRLLRICKTRGSSSSSSEPLVPVFWTTAAAFAAASLYKSLYSLALWSSKTARVLTHLTCIMLTRCRLMPSARLPCHTTAHAACPRRYFTGVTAILQSLGIINNSTRLAGSSGGAITAAAICSNVPASSQQLAANFNIAATCRPSFACRGYLDKVVRNYTTELFPASVTEQCNRRLFVTVTEARPNNLTDRPQVCAGRNWIQQYKSSSSFTNVSLH